MFRIQVSGRREIQSGKGTWENPGREHGNFKDTDPSLLKQLWVRG